jgi:malate dehydrogenase
MTKVVVAGAAGGIGQPLSLLLKLSPYVTELALYDVVNTPGVAADLSHISTAAAVTGHLPKKSAADDPASEDGLKEALTGAGLVIVPAGVPRKPGMTRDDLFNVNAGIVRTIADGVARHAPTAFLLIISNPVNSTVPVAVGVLRQHGVFDARRVFGVTTLDVVRAATFTSSVLSRAGEATRPDDVAVPVVGGHSGETIVPLLSQATVRGARVSGPGARVLAPGTPELAALVKRIQFGGDEVVQAKNGGGSATLSMAYAGYTFAEAVLRAAAVPQSPNPAAAAITAETYVYIGPGSQVAGAAEVRAALGLDYFSVPVALGPAGATRVLDPALLTRVSDYERGLLQVAAKGLANNIRKGLEFVEKNPVNFSKL